MKELHIWGLAFFTLKCFYDLVTLRFIIILMAILFLSVLLLAIRFYGKKYIEMVEENDIENIDVVDEEYLEFPEIEKQQFNL
jgi:hypothetical protein